MAKETNIEAVIRDGSGKSAVKKVIAGGKIPSILYGHKGLMVSCHLQ